MNGLCSHERLELALAGSLNADEESTLHLHLDECELCAAEMERLSGGEQASREIAAMLMPDELDDALPLREECSTADFVVDHLEPSDDPAVLGRLGGYDVLDIIGRGGMGVVLKGFDRELKRFVAIKALAPHLAHSALARKRFAREAQAAAAVVNLHVIAIHQVQPNGQLPFLVMPLLTGESLAQRLKARGTLELKEILRIGMQAAEGLAAAHGQGLIHRDVKPANILLEKGVERAVLTDFGLARAADDVSMTRQGIIAGTPEYMSPEQARGEALDGRSDLFSLGCVLYEMATGVSPFRTESTLATLRRIVDEQPAAMASLVPELPPWFSHIVRRLLSKDPAQRFASASEVSQLLEQCLSHLQQPASVPLPASLVPHTAGRWSNFKVTRKGVIAMLGTIGMTLLGMVMWQTTEAPDISGQWTSDEWGTVVLEAKGPGQYEGTFASSGKGTVCISDGLTLGTYKLPDSVKIDVPALGPIPTAKDKASTFHFHAGIARGISDKDKSGTVHLKWSRVERRFNGTWGKDNDRSGKLSLRLVGNEIRGGWTTDKDAQKETGTPRLGDLLWTRSQERSSEASKSPAPGAAAGSRETTSVEPSPGVENNFFVRRSENSVKVEGQFDGNEEVLLVIGDPETPTEMKGRKELHWPVPVEKAGEYTFEVRRDMLKLDGGGTAPGLVFQVQGLPNTFQNTSNITTIGKYLQPDGKVVISSPKNKLLLKRKTDHMIVVVGHVEYPDASTLPVHILIRRKAEPNAGTFFDEPSEANKSTRKQQPVNAEASPEPEPPASQKPTGKSPEETPNPADAKVTGLITRSGKPLTGKVTFHLDDQIVVAKIKEDGTYTLNRVLAGTYIATLEGNGVPAQFTVKDETPLRVEVKAGNNTFNFELQ